MEAYLLHISMASIIGIVGWSARSITTYLKELTKSVIELNINMAAVVEKVGSHEKRIDRLERKRG